MIVTLTSRSARISRQPRSPSSTSRADSSLRWRKTPSDIRAGPFDGRFGAFAEPGKPGRVHLAWVGGAGQPHHGDRRRRLGSITFDMGPQPCDSIGVGRELVLDFEGTVDVPASSSGRGRFPDPGAGWPPMSSTAGRWTGHLREKAPASSRPHRTKRVLSISSPTCAGPTPFFDDGSGRRGSSTASLRAIFVSSGLARSNDSATWLPSAARPSVRRQALRKPSVRRRAS